MFEFYRSLNILRLILYFIYLYRAGKKSELGLLISPCIVAQKLIIYYFSGMIVNGSKKSLFKNSDFIHLYEICHIN